MKGDTDFIGLSLAEASALTKSRDPERRALKVDGEYKIMGMDYRLTRVNFEVEKDIVVATNPG